MRFILINPLRDLVMLQMFWADRLTNAITGERRNSSILIRPGPEAQTAVFHVSDTIDQIRLDPGIDPVTVFELYDVDLLTRKGG